MVQSHNGKAYGSKNKCVTAIYINVDESTNYNIELMKQITEDSFDLYKVLKQEK